MQGWVMRFSIQVWVFMFGYSYSGSEFWSSIVVTEIQIINVDWGYDLEKVMVRVDRVVSFDIVDFGKWNRRKWW